MFISYINESRRLNRLNFDSFPGKRVYYSKIKNSLSIVVKIAFLTIFVTSVVYISKTDQVQYLTLLGVPVGLFLLNSIFQSIGRLLLKNPVFILKGESLYYIYTNEWYDIRNYHFSDEYIGRHNYYATYCMVDQNKTHILREKNWHLKDEEVFKSHVKYNQLILLKNQDSEN